ncbi:uncharacterized protein K460DRAFT_417723 [Cucurbitaria berberidis CBS 394.84]|uniref:Uncharacterized protein n=1 Tax=Cucurbitaria berberidis CBS 394.84 TaxID=1168544 RepID=A0A9P4GKA5_9PLEO|nr:uncharacterized protein K460DRAFT_417723 [Cucurbitaria berberidis CBS 394.84]KAF1846686.1 hypothetical protein K460DRAFT_417723 [Cucurbitaria berberidis CBS 394.84]
MPSLPPHRLRYDNAAPEVSVPLSPLAATIRGRRTPKLIKAPRVTWATTNASYDEEAEPGLRASSPSPSLLLVPGIYERQIRSIPHKLSTLSEASSTSTSASASDAIVSPVHGQRQRQRQRQRRSTPSLTTPSPSPNSHDVLVGKGHNAQQQRRSVPHVRSRFRERVSLDGPALFEGNPDPGVNGSVDGGKEAASEEEEGVDDDEEEEDEEEDGGEIDEEEEKKKSEDEYDELARKVLAQRARRASWRGSLERAWKAVKRVFGARRHDV